MSTKRLTRGIAIAGALALATGLLGSGTAQAAPDPSDAGRLVTWGATGSDPLPLPDELDSVAIAQVVQNAGDQAVFLTAAGRVVMRDGTLNDGADALPSELVETPVKSIGAYDRSYVAVPVDGDPVFWGMPGASNSDTGSADVSDLSQIALGGSFGVGLKEDGTVVAWGRDNEGQTDVPAGLDDVTKVVAGADHAYALKANGTVVAWGRDAEGQVSLPAGLAEPGAVLDIAARDRGGLALLSDHTVVSWGQYATTPRFGTKYNLPPASLTGKNITKIAAGGTASNLAVDSDGNITAWGNNMPDAVPTDLDGNSLSQISTSSYAAFAIQRAVLAITPSKVTGTAKEGQTLTGTPATFSGSPEISYQWLANGSPISGATETTLKLSAAQAGKKISFRTIATTDDETVNSDSAATAAVKRAVLATKSKTTVQYSKKKHKAVVTTKVTAKGATPTGKVKITVKKGKKKVIAKNVKLNKRGVAKLTVKKSKLKKTGKYKVTTAYAGNSKFTKSTSKATFKVTR